MQPALAIVDNDETMRDALSVLFGYEGFDIECFTSGAQFLAQAQERCFACVIVDAQLASPSGQEILSCLRDMGFAAPVVLISDTHDIRAAVLAVKAGAADFIEKPLDMASIAARIREVIAASPQKKETESAVIDFPGRKLTPREHDVLLLIASGASNKEAGRHLGISPRTIEAHRARIMEKLGARNAADLVRIVLTSQANRQATSFGGGAQSSA